jgi:hypothetical protein
MGCLLDALEHAYRVLDFDGESLAWAAHIGQYG